MAKKKTETIDGIEYETLFSFGSGKKMEKPKPNRNRKVTADKEIDVGV